jgi:leucyl-tRNA synthetase
MKDRSYDPSEVEPKWQKRWEETGLNEVDLRGAKRPFYNLMMFPYPSAEGLHVGNVFAFTGADIYGRYQRLKGHDVFQPIGFDAFGIHSENYALKVGTHPMRLIPANIENFRRQLKRMGFMYDWRYEVQTTDPRYYKWTQWIFLQLYKAGLAYRAEAPVNWCPACKTVLANEQVIGGMCERHPDTAVERRLTEQWFFRITAYAQRLLENLDWIDWSETTKTAQRNWIGRSEGAEIRFPIEGREGTITVFTTRPDTLFGATYMVLAPEHPLVERLVSAEQREKVLAYREEALRKRDIDRVAADREKSGVSLGANAINPATNEPIPIWISDYVLMEYGTGAIMAVPAHDQRDYEFAQRFGLPIRQVISPTEGEAPSDAAYEGEGVLVNSGPYDGLPSQEAKWRITDDLAEKGLAARKVQYRLRDWCISRQRYWGPPIPMIHCPSCGIQPVPEEDLPVLLPDLEHFEPDASGLPPLARSKEFYETTCPRCHGPAHRDPDVNDNFLDSAWYFLRYPSAQIEERAWDPELTKKWLPVDMYIGGNEHAVLHLMYTRFLCLAFQDMGLTHFGEPFKRFRAHGLLIKEGAKMSKSRGNVVNPDAYVAEYGADTLRMYLMFLGPFSEGGDFRDEGIRGIRRFLDRVYRFFADAAAEGGALQKDAEAALPRDVQIKIHQTIKKVTLDIENLSYNTAIAALMELYNTLRDAPRVNRWSLEVLAKLLSPFVPHLAEELWEMLGHEESVFRTEWPEYDPDLTVTDMVEIAIQVNGKLRDTVSLPRDASKEAVLEAALKREKVKGHVEGKNVRKVIHVPNRILNIVVS